MAKLSNEFVEVLQVKGQLVDLMKEVERMPHMRHFDELTERINDMDKDI